MDGKQEKNYDQIIFKSWVIFMILLLWWGGDENERKKGKRRKESGIAICLCIIEITFLVLFYISCGWLQKFEVSQSFLVALSLSP